MAEAHAWHASEELLRRYAAGGLDTASAWSIESHLPGCADCRRLAGPLVAPQRTRPSEPTARLLAATPSLTLSWLLAVGLVLAFALEAALVTGGREGFTLFL